MPSHGTILDNGPVKLVKLDPSDPSYKDPKLWKGDKEATHALFKCSACRVVFCYAILSKDRMAHKARQDHSTALVAVSSGDPQRPKSNQVVRQPSARQAPLARTSDSTAQADSSQVTTNTLTRTNINERTVTHSEGTFREKETRPDGTVLEREWTNKTSSVTELQTRVDQLQQTVAQLTHERLDLAIKEESRVKALVDLRDKERREEHEWEKRQREQDRDRFLARQSYQGGASAKDVFLLSQMVVYYRILIWDKLDEDTRKALLATPQDPSFNRWAWTTFFKECNLDAKEEISRLAAADVDSFENEFPTVSWGLNGDPSDILEELKWMGIWPEPEPEDTEDDSDEQMSIDEVVQDGQEEHERSTLPSEIDGVDASMWTQRGEDDGMTLLEKTLRNYRFQTYKNASYEGRAVGPPKLIKIVEASTNQVLDSKALRFLCCFQHPSGNDVRLWVLSALIMHIPEYKKVVDAFKASI